MADYEEDCCDCPACEPACKKAGQPCFIPCERCQRPEVDENGPLNSKTRRVNRPLASEDDRPDETIGFGLIPIRPEGAVIPPEDVVKYIRVKRRPRPPWPCNIGTEDERV